VRGFNLFMAVERDRYYGAAIDAARALEPHAAWIRPLVAALAEVDWPALRRKTPIALRRHARGCAVRKRDVAARSDDRRRRRARPRRGGAAEPGRWRDRGASLQSAIASALELAQVPYAIVDEPAPLDGYRAGSS
jgi:hypothetical protein